MQFNILIKAIADTSWYKELLNYVRDQTSVRQVTLLDAAKPFLVAALYQDINLPIIFIKSHYDRAKSFFADLKLWCPYSHPILFYPEVDLLNPSFTSQDRNDLVERANCLAALTRSSQKAQADAISPLIVTSASAAIVKTISQVDFVDNIIRITVGTQVTPLQLVEKLQSDGYELDHFVEIPGFVSRRGGILDVFPVTGSHPIRIEFDGEIVDSIRKFDPKTQKSFDKISEVTIEPMELSKKTRGSSSLIDYLPDKSILILDEQADIENSINDANTVVAELLINENSRDESISFDENYLYTYGEFVEKTNQIQRKLYLTSWVGSPVDIGNTTIVPTIPVRQFSGDINNFSRELNSTRQMGNRIVIITQQSVRLSELLIDSDIIASPVNKLDILPPDGTVTIVQGSLSEGWTFDSALAIYTDKEVFGFQKKHRQLSRRRDVRHHNLLSDFIPDDYVVHIEHGIGKYVGLKAMNDGSVEREYMVLEYSAGDKLYVPADQMDRVSKYIGGNELEPHLARLGTQEWLLTKQRVKKSVADMAEELLRLYAVRETIKGFTFSKDTLWQQEMESSFPFVETPDQLNAINAVKADMENTRPMDRLICGDVGYGKTEIALRAAFKAVMDNKQVAVLVPTTLLAQQHLITFQERLKLFPVTVKVLSRLTSEDEQREIISQLATGFIDICVGTHRIIQRDVLFKDLGLLIIDEEQRFGVVHKEYFKKMRREIDVITLSATPIPRTIHMALAGIRDLSTMETPPEDRLPIKTYVGCYDEKLIREAILREKGRHGQVFFVHNRINNIDQVAGQLKQLVPEARIAYAHGQMKEDYLEEIMTKFIDGNIDVLISTTIIESGLDIPNANTLIINDSDRLGLSQLYQLRGRVGRGSANAFAYFLFNGKRQLTEQARKRLETICSATELGAGFAIAMKDMEIRGAGNILGAEQSGYVSSVGFDLYSKLLAEAVIEAREHNSNGINVRRDRERTLSISLPLAYCIPSEYITDDAARVSYYRRLANANDLSEIKSIGEEIRDKYGVLPQQVESLIYMLEVKSMMPYTGLESILTKGNLIILSFNDRQRLVLLEQVLMKKDGVKFGNRQIIINTKQYKDCWKNFLKYILDKEHDDSVTQNG